MPKKPLWTCGRCRILLKPDGVTRGEHAEYLQGDRPFRVDFGHRSVLVCV